MASDSKTRTAFDRASGLTSQVLEELKQGDLPQSLRRDFKDTYDFYIPEETQLELADMGRVKKSVFLTWHLLKSLFFKLSPSRRLMLLIGVFLTFVGIPNSTGQIVAGLMGVLFVLGLELKDKLQAKDELEEGRAIQIALTPDSEPEIEGWDVWIYSSPANEVGGDLVDHMRIGVSAVSLTLGDVAGKGLSAALMMAKLQATLRALCPEPEDLSSDSAVRSALEDTASRVNRIICRDGLPSKFASLVHLIIDEKSGSLFLLNAGHLPPLVVRKDGVDEYRRKSPAIGLSARTTFHATTLDLEPDDLMIIYSDGVTEARSTDGEFLGEHRLEAIAKRLRGMSAQQAGSQLLTSVREFENGAPRHDDLSVIMLRRRASGGSSHILNRPLHARD